MIYVKTNLKASLWLALGHIFKIQKEVKSMQKQPNCIKRVWPSKNLGALLKFITVSSTSLHLFHGHHLNFFTLVF